MANTVVANTSAALAAKTLLTAEDSQIITGDLLPSSDSSVIGLMRRSVTPLTNAQIKALPTTAITLVAAPTGGTRIRVLNASFQINTVAGAYTNLNATYCALAIYYLGDFTQWAQLPIVDDVTAPASTHLTDFLASAGHKLVDSSVYADWWGGQWVLPNVQAAASMDGIALALKMDNNGSGNLTGGNALNTGNIVVYYVIETIV